MSVKFQITLPEETILRWKREAAKRRQPLAQLVRETVEATLKQDTKDRGKDPFAWIPQASECSETDLAARVDEIVYG
jgi:hypothetical protein